VALFIPRPGAALPPPSAEFAGHVTAREARARPATGARNGDETLEPRKPAQTAALTKIEAIIREQTLDAVVERLVHLGVRGLTISDVKGAGRSGGRHEVFRGSAYQVAFVPKILVEWVGPDDQAEAILRAIEQRANTGQIGDGKIFVQRVEEAVRVRTGERGDLAV